MKAKPKAPKAYTKNTLHKLLGCDRGTLDRALVGVRPARTAGKRQFYRIEDAQTALAERVNPALRKIREQEARLRCERLAFRNAKERGELTDTRLLIEEVGRMLLQFRNLVYVKFENEAPVAMAGIGVAEARIIGRRMAAELLTSLQNCFKNLKA